MLPLSNETPVTSPRHSIHHSDSMNSRSPHDHSRNLNTTNDLNKQNSPARQLYSDTRNMGKIQFNINRFYLVNYIFRGDFQRANLHQLIIFCFVISADPRNSIAGDRRPGNIPLPHRPMNLGLDMNQPRKLPQPMLETKTDYGKYR